DLTLCLWAVPSGALGWLGKRILGVPYAVWALGSDLWRRNSYPLGGPIVRMVLQAADALYANSRELSQDVETVAGRPALLLPASRRLPKPASPFPRPAGISKWFLCVARFHPNKGVDVLIEAIALIPPEQRLGMLFEIFGDGPERQSLLRRTRELGVEHC